MKTPAWSPQVLSPRVTLATDAWLLGSQVEKSHQCESLEPKGHCPRVTQPECPPGVTADASP